MNVARYIDQLNKLHMAKANGHVSPHKAVMLLAVSDLVASGDAADNQIRLGPEMMEHFRRYFDIVRTDADSCTPLNPFFYLRSEPFWHHQAMDGKEAVCEALSGPGGRKKLEEVVDYSFLDDELYALLLSPEARKELRDSIITRYFPNHYEALVQIANEEDAVGIYAEAMKGMVDGGRVQELPTVEPQARDLAFARVVKREYHYQCAACGLRILFDGISLVDAAHIIPFSESHDDDPRNGMSLCKNHHWAMDQELIFPCSDNKWHVHCGIDDRLDSQRSLIDLDGKRIITPNRQQYAPKLSSLVWRENRLKLS
jgi:putative restriction endonuclease